MAVKKSPAASCSSSSLTAARTALGAALAHRGEPQGVADLAGQRGGARPLAAHVADRDGPQAEAELEHVVEVAADLPALRARAVRGAELEPRDRRQTRRQQAVLQRLGDLARRLLGLSGAGALGLLSLEQRPEALLGRRCAR